jgi:hypothetical protein
MRRIIFNKALDRVCGRAYSPPPVAILKGVVTGEGIGKQRGDALFEGDS